MIEGFDERSLVILNLINPKEKFVGILRGLSPAGVTTRAVNLDTFDDWIHQIARGEECDIEMITMFAPLSRVERIFLDEPSGVIKSYSQRFQEVVGKSVEEYLGL
jgi:hypothetical protein